MNSEKGEQPVKSLIEAAGIKRVIYVDDAFAAKVDDVISEMAGASPEERAEILGGDVGEMGQEDLWQERVREHWDELDARGRASLADRVYARDSDGVALKSSFVEVLSGLVPEVEHVSLTLAEWREKKGDLITEFATVPSLILFDQDYTHEQGGSDEGQRLIADLENDLGAAGETAEKPDVFYGLVSNTFKVGEEPARRNQIIDEAGLDPLRFVVISKQNLDESDHERLAFRLRTMLLAPTFAQLMHEVSEAVSTAGAEAVKKVQKMTADDLEHMVIRSSAEEGVWPADTMLRILEIMQRAKVGRFLHSEPRVIALTERLRSLSGLLPDNVPGEESTGELADEASEVEWAPVAVEIAHDEIYEEGDLINALHLPLALGDVFERADGFRFVVVAQPCDLEVRAGGLRAPDLSHVTLARIDDGEEGDDRRFAAFKLPYFERGQAASAYVQLNRPTTVRAAVLDACVFNADGKARLELDAEEGVLLLPYWGLRRVLLAKTFGAALDDAGKVGPNAGEETKKAIAGDFKRDPFKILDLDLEKRVIEWDCRRLCRICDPYARALLARFSQYYARDAYLHDMARGESA
jgi:hypothetical protein